jgi:hypothetical protein
MIVTAGLASGAASRAAPSDREGVTVATIMAVLLNLFRWIFDPPTSGHASCSMMVAKSLGLFRAV